MDPETWILQRILRYIWMLRHGSGDMDLAEDPYWWMLRHESDTWIRRHGSCKGSWDIKMLRHESETWILQRILKYKDAETWIRRHGSCKGSWDTNGCWDMDPETWILQRILRYKWMLRHGSGDMDLAEDPEKRMLRHGSGDMDLAEDPNYTWMLRHESETWILQRIPSYEDTETWIRRRGSCRGSWDAKMLRHEPGDMDLAEDPEINMDADIWLRRHGCCRGSWEKDAETWIRRHGSCRGS